MFINIGVVNSVFDLNVSAAERMVGLMMASHSVDGVVTNTQQLITQSGMSRNTYNRAVASLCIKGIITKVSKGVYKFTVTPLREQWLNLVQFKKVLQYELPFKEKLVALAIAKHIPEGESTCWPKVSTLASLVGITARSVQRVLSKLSVRGLLHRFKEGGRWFLTLKNDTPKRANNDELRTKMAELRTKMTPSKKEKHKDNIEKGGQAPKGYTSCSAEGKGVPPSGGNKKFRKPRKKRERSSEVVLQKVMTKKRTPKPTIEGLAYIWRRDIPQILGLSSMVEGSITYKQTMMLKQVLKVSNQWQVDPVNMFEHVLHNWGEYTAQVAVAMDLPSTPGEPKIEWIVKWVAQLCQGYIKFKAEKDVQVIAPTKKHSVNVTLADLKKKFGGNFDELK